MPNEVRGRLDHAIDRAVRGMMQVDPQPGLRHRVAERLNGPARRSWLVPAFAAAAVVLVLIASIVTLRIAPSAPSTTPQIATAPTTATPQQPAAAEIREQPAAAPQVASAPRTPAVHRPVPPAADRRGGSIFGPPSQRVTAASVGPEPTPAAEQPVLLITAPGALEQIPPIVVEPIVVTPITITPLIVRAPDRR